VSLPILTKLSEDERISALIKISSVEFSQSTDDIKQSLHRNLIEQTLFHINKPSTVEEIRSTLEKEFFEIKLLDDIILDVLEGFINEGMVFKEGEYYFISEEKHKKIGDKNKKSRELKQKAFKDLYDDIKKVYEDNITVEETNVIVRCYYNFIIWLVSSRSGKISNLIIKGELKNIRYTSYDRKINEILYPIENIKLKKVVKKTIIKLFQEANDNIMNYLYELSNKFICLQVLNLDPECQNIKIESLSEKKLFLDTNVLISLITEEKMSNIDELLSLSVGLGVQLYITENTISEYLTVVERSDENYKNLASPQWILKKVDDPFIRHYAENKEESWEEYFLELSNIEQILRKYNINYYKEDHESIKNLMFFKELVEEVKKCSLITRKNPKKEKVAEHDAFHLILIKELRTTESSNILGPNHWFLSFDFTLPCTDRYISKNFGYIDVSTPVMIINIWVEIISQFNIRDVTKKQLADIFSEFVSSAFSPIDESIDIDVLLIIQGDWLNYKWLDEKKIINLLHSKFVVDYATKLKESYSAGDRALQEKLRAEFSRKFNEILGREFDSEYVKIEKEKEELKEKYETEAEFAKTWRKRSGYTAIFMVLLGSLSFAIYLTSEVRDSNMIAIGLILLAVGVVLYNLTIEPENVSSTTDIGISLDLKRLGKT